MNNTKEKILNTALRLFAQNGYEAVSVSNIAGELGITKGALYKHYKNKKDIFDSIVERMYKTDAERSQKYNVPQDDYNSDPNAYKSTSLDSVKNFTFAQFKFWTEDEFASYFRRMCVLEQYRNAEIAELYVNCIGFGPVYYLKDIFGEMIKKGILKSGNSYSLAVEFYAPMYLFIDMYDHFPDKYKLTEMLKDHIKNFLKKYIAEERLL